MLNVRIRNFLANAALWPPIATVNTLPHTRSCFVCGEANSAGLNLRFETDGAIVRSRFVPRPEHAGFKGIVHGGIVTALLDEIMVWACFVATRRFAFCAEITVRFVKPVLPGNETIATATRTADRRGKIFEAKSELRDAQGELLASAHGKYLPIQAADAAARAEDLVEIPKWMTGEQNSGM